MEMMRRVMISLVMILLSAPLIHGQDLSKYRGFSFGMSLVEISKQVDSQPLHTKLIHKRPAVIQEVTWWPRESSESSLQAEPVWQVLFSFYNGEVYRILVTYDQRATAGLGIEDMVEAVSAKYGSATRPDVEISFPTNELYYVDRKGDRPLGRFAILGQPFPFFLPEYFWTCHVLETAGYTGPGRSC